MKKFLLAFVMLLAVGGGCLKATSPSGDTKPVDGNDTPVGSICKDTCGNGTCEEIVCQGTGCPCSETAESCPKDCNAGAVDLSDLIQVTSPVANAKVASPLTVTGKARGTWYFEASFPVKVYDANDQLLGTGIAQAQSEWMTEDFVNFVANVTFTTPTTATGKVVLEKDNPSGLPEHDNSITVAVKF